jgi:NAD(P)-dependent dehydrogenase (short-subunit alcohol dehydrogenase family)
MQIASLFEQASRYYGHIDIVVSNSGLEHFGSLQEVTPEEFDRVFAVNTRGQFFVAQQAHRYLTEGGCLVLMSSISAHATGVRKHSLYSGSKAAVEAFARCLATGDKCIKQATSLPTHLLIEFSDKKITVNAIAPGGVNTEATRKYIHRSEGGPNEQWRWSDENVEEVVAPFMQPHTAVVSDVVARILSFLASEDGCLTNGETNGIVRGLHLQ